MRLFGFVGIYVKDNFFVFERKLDYGVGCVWFGKVGQG